MTSHFTEKLRLLLDTHPAYSRQFKVSELPGAGIAIATKLTADNAGDFAFTLNSDGSPASAHLMAGAYIYRGAWNSDPLMDEAVEPAAIALVEHVWSTLKAREVA